MNVLSAHGVVVQIAGGKDVPPRGLEGQGAAGKGELHGEAKQHQA